MAKGFAFSLDAIFAIIVLGVFISALFFLSAQSEEDPYPSIILKKQADDALIAIDKTGELATLNTTLINNSLNSTFPSSVSWYMNITYYTYSSGNFTSAGNVTFGEDYSSAREIVAGQREFLVFENRSIQYYGIARLRLWVE